VAPRWDEITSLDDYLDATRRMSEPYTVPALGCDIIVLPPHVMSPAFDCASHFIAEGMIDIIKGGERVLDVGSGCGILSVIASRAGAAQVTALDINPHAVENTKLNFEAHNVVGDVLLGGAFGALRDEDSPFDLIVFHAPFTARTPRDYLEAGACDPGYRALKTVILDAHRYLRNDGHLIIGFSATDGDEQVLSDTIAASRFKEVERRTKEAYGEVYLFVVLGLK